MKHQEMISKMTLEEKAAFLSGKGEWQTWNFDRLGIPSMYCSDGPHGIRKQAGAGDHLGLNPSLPATCFPTAATMANSWDPELGEEIGKALGEEAEVQDVHVVLGPGRRPRTGAGPVHARAAHHAGGRLHHRPGTAGRNLCSGAVLLYLFCQAALCAIRRANNARHRFLPLFCHAKNIPNRKANGPLAKQKGYAIVRAETAATGSFSGATAALPCSGRTGLPSVCGAGAFSAIGAG